MVFIRCWAFEVLCSMFQVLVLKHRTSNTQYRTRTSPLRCPWWPRCKPLPNGLAILPDLADSMKRHMMEPPFFIHQVECPRSFRREINRLKRNLDDPPLNPIEITQFKSSARKFFVPTNSIQYVLDGRHLMAAFSSNIEFRMFGQNGQNYRNALPLSKNRCLRVFEFNGA